MANTTIKIKRSGVAGNPSTLAQGELAYSWLTDNGSNGGQRLYIGTGTETDGDAANHVVIGGEFFTNMLDHNKGTLTASSAVIVDANKKIDEFNVDNITLDGNTISTTNTNGNLSLSPNGAGKVQVSGAYTLPNADGTLNQYLKTDGAGSVSFSTLPDATTTTKGVASFNSASFSTSSGAVSIKTGGVSNLQLANDDVTIGSTSIALGATSTSLAGLTELTVDNLNFNGNTISATDQNGNITLDPNGAGTVDVNGAKITSVGTPQVDTDAANKGYVDTVAQGLHAVPAADAATTANLSATYNHAAGTLTATVNGAFPTIDGVTLVQSDNLVVKNQTNAYQNGSYILTTVGDAGTPWVLTRCSFCNEQAEIPGTFEFVTFGTVYKNTGWVITVPADFVFGSTNASSDNGFTTKGDIVWVQFSGAGAYTAGDGLSLVGNEFAVKVAATGGIEISSDALQLKSTVAGDGLTILNGVLAVGGTTNRISVAADSIDIASTYLGQTSITTLGTIGTGVWNGTTIGTGYGGTGLTTYTVGDLLYATGTNTLGKLPVGLPGQILQLGGSPSSLEWGDIDGGSY